jgi:hypothetical protein
MNTEAVPDAEFYDYVADNFPTTSMKGEMESLNPEKAEEDEQPEVDEMENY